MPVEITADDRLAAKRLDGLLDYVEALVKLDERLAARLAQHRLADGSQFILHQHELAGLPGLSLDGSDSEGPIWLRIERLQRTAPPEPEERCSPWIEVSNDPAKPMTANSWGTHLFGATPRTLRIGAKSDPQRKRPIFDG